MTSFVHVDHPTQHPGVVRAERVAESVKNLARRASTAPVPSPACCWRPSSPPSLVVANEVVDTWTEGHLMAAWILMWTVGFAASALLAAPARRAAAALRAGLKRWAAARRQAAQDEKFWNVALTDARVMADISRAMSADAARDVRGYY